MFNSNLFSIQIITTQSSIGHSHNTIINTKMEEDMNNFSNKDGDKLEEASIKDTKSEKAKARGRRTARCKYCDKAFSSKHLSQHIKKVHLKLDLEKCPNCVKSFDKKYLKLHREAVHLKTQTECPDCGKSLKMSMHRRHTCKGKNKVICHLCGKEYFKCRLQKHIRNVHNGKSGKDNVQSEYVQCDLCPKRIVKGNMKRHQAIHRKVFIKALCV